MSSTATPRRIGSRRAGEAPVIPARGATGAVVGAEELGFGAADSLGRSSVSRGGRRIAYRAWGSSAEAKLVGSPRLFVGSNATQPIPSKYTSDQACSCALATEKTGSPSTVWPVPVPGRYPSTIRAGIPSERAMSVNAEEKWMQ